MNTPTTCPTAADVATTSSSIVVLGAAMTGAGAMPANVAEMSISGVVRRSLHHVTLSNTTAHCVCSVHPIAVTACLRS
eukprot:m.49878 g.49878  ORF g.49878 m.49878 type:complete len:78 (+) comp16222_c0_seq1:1364-1597(+)